VILSAALLSDKQDKHTYCLTGECSRDVRRCLTKHAAVASLMLRKMVVARRLEARFRVGWQETLRWKWIRTIGPAVKYRPLGRPA
jgi:hypothetical protein